MAEPKQINYYGEQTIDNSELVDQKIEEATSGAVVKKYPDSEHYDPNAQLDEEGKTFKFNELELHALSDEAIDQLWSEV